jgi:uncharacterized protein YjbI with pentapeptide repeats
MQYTKEKIEELQARWQTPKGKEFVKKIKQTRCYLSPVLFRKVVQNFPHINDEEVIEAIDLRGINLSGFDFRIPVKEDESGFEEEMAILSYIHFEGATLKHATFQDGKVHDCFFENSDITHTNFKNAALNTCNFQEADATGMLITGGSFMNCNFTHTKLHDINLSAVITDQSTIFSEKIKDELEGNFHIASLQYKQIREMYKNSSLHAQADFYHYREMISRRKQMEIYNPLRLVNYIFADLSCKYGTSVMRIVAWMAVIIILFTLLYWMLQSVQYNNEPAYLTLFDSLYFSLTTYTTIGYGDFHPVGIFRIFTAIEGLLGAILTSLFTVIVARRIIRD